MYVLSVAEHSDLVRNPGDLFTCDIHVSQFVLFILQGGRY